MGFAREKKGIKSCDVLVRQKIAEHRVSVCSPERSVKLKSRKEEDGIIQYIS